MLAWLRRFCNRLALGCLLVAALLGGSTAIQHFWPVPSGVNQANFRRIALGMPRAEVEKLLGAAPAHNTPIQSPDKVRDYRSVYPDLQKPYPDRAPYPLWYCQIWSDRRLAIVVIFDEDDRVVARRHLEDDATSVEKTRRWLADQWGKTPQGRKALIEAILSRPGFEEDSKFSPREVLDNLHDRYAIEFRIDPADFGVQDAEEFLNRQVGIEESANKDLRANLDEVLRKVKATYVIEDGAIRIVPLPSKE